MIPYRFKDGSILEQYENGDIVEVTEDDRYRSISLGYSKGEWGRVILREQKDKEQGHTGSISHIGIQLAGVSTPENSFQQCISSIPVWNVKLKLDL